MAQPQQNITIAAPGFGGLNTETSPVQQNEAFAAVADNCVIDRYGRVGSRKGYVSQVTDGSALSSASVDAIAEFVGEDGSTTMFCAGNGKILKDVSGTLTDVTPAGYGAISADNWQIIPFNDQCFFVQRGYDPIVYDRTGDTYQSLTDLLRTIKPKANCGVAAAGRLWLADTDTDQSTVYWSDLLIGSNFDSGTAGSIDISEYWPRGHDTITGITIHNNFLIIFGKESILVYEGAAGDPATNLSLVDTVDGMGCIARDTIKNTGSDVFFLDNSGVRSFARTIQEKSMPIGEVSANIRTELQEEIGLNSDNIFAFYSQEESIYVLTFPTSALSYCFSTKGLNEDGTHRCTKWLGQSYQCATRTQSGFIMVGGVADYLVYGGYTDDGATYTMAYTSNPLSFGDSTRLKFPKQVDWTIISSSDGVFTTNWAFDYRPAGKTKDTDMDQGGAPGEYNVGEYNIAEFTGGVAVQRYKVNLSGHGVYVQIGMSTTISGALVSLQEINIQALLGRIT